MIIVWCIASITQSCIIAPLSFMLVGSWFGLASQNQVNAAIEFVTRYLTIPFLIAHPIYVVGAVVYDSGFMAALGITIRSVVAWWLWQMFKNRRNKRRRAAKLLAKVREAGHRLIVVPVPAGGRA